MSVVIETLIFCDGKDCALDGPYCDGDGRSESAMSQRRGFEINGWRRVGSKDYCPHCILKLPIRGAPSPKGTKT